ncbi:MAG: hypothetical protein HY911_04410 [Desulfobacterales bacterium]|nr:hypothetical protein [Desulfobacterales bacterium]
MNEANHHIKIDDLTGDARQIAEIIGLPALLALAEQMGGGYIYLPRPDHLSLPARDRGINAEFTGRNIRELANKHNLTLRRIRQITRRTGRSSTVTADDESLYKQQKMF